MKNYRVQLSALFQHSGVLTATEIAGKLRLSQPSISRLLRSVPGVVRIGQGRRTRYGLARDVVGTGQTHWPLYHIDAAGNAHEIAQFHALYGGHGLWYLEGAENWLTLREGEFADGLFNDLPWFLVDGRPQGYLGRQLAHLLSRQYPYFSKDPRLWSSNQIFQCFLEWGHSLPVAFIIGDHALRRFLEEEPTPAPTDPVERTDHYLKQIQEHELLPPQSSAGGEQPKFTSCYLEGSVLHHTIVKFSSDTQLPTGQRWADLLRAENQAIQLLSHHLQLPIYTRILDGGSRVFLEYNRFDRIGTKGRRTIVSLESLDAAFLGMNGNSWPDVARTLQSHGWIGRDDAERIALYWHFGTLIGNTDMHFGNLAFFLHPEKPLQVCPPYDMLPMLYAPDRQGEIRDSELRISPPLPRERDLWQCAAQLAIAYWQQLAESSDLSASFRAIAAQNARLVATACRNIPP